MSHGGNHPVAYLREDDDNSEWVSLFQWADDHEERRENVTAAYDAWVAERLGVDPYGASPFIYDANWRPHAPRLYFDGFLAARHPTPEPADAGDGGLPYPEHLEV